jgi:hypothetical protein
MTPEKYCLRVGWGPVSLRVLPAKPSRQEKPKRAKKKAAPEPEEAAKAKSKKERRFSLSMLPLLLKAVTRALGRLLRGIRVERLYSHIVAARGDAAKTAVLFGAVHAALGLVGPALERRADKLDVTVGVDYELPSPKLYLSAALSIRTGTLLAVAFSLAFSALRVRRTAPSGKRAEERREGEDGRKARSA